MLVGRCSSELSGHQNLKEIKKVTTSDRSEAQWRDLLFPWHSHTLLGVRPPSPPLWQVKREPQASPRTPCELPQP
jgi:hypothetical protein